MIYKLNHGELIYLFSKNDIYGVEEFGLNSHFILAIAHVFQFFKSIYQLLFKTKVK